VNGNGTAHVESTPAEVHERCVTASQVKDKPRRYLMRDRIPFAELWALTGEAGIGKSTLAASIAAAVSIGGWLPGDTPLTPGRVAWFSGEESLASATKGRLKAAGADLGNIIFPELNKDHKKVNEFHLPGMFPELLRIFNGEGITFAHFDGVSNYFSKERGVDLEDKVIRSLTSMSNLAEETGASVGFTRNTRKGATGPGLQRISGSAFYGNIPRAVLWATAHPQYRNMRLLLSVKQSYGPEPPGIDFSMTVKGGHNLVIWGKGTGLTAADVERGVTEPVDRIIDNHGSNVIKAFLKDGEQLSTDFWLECERHRLSRRDVYRLQEELGIKCEQSKKSGERKWYVRLPDADTPG
jgi:hypothetical protein